MQDFWLYFNLGREHIADLAGYDHILFIAALCLAYLPRDWKTILILVTAFTIGHSITLALSALKLVNIPGNFIEFLIPVTILLAALGNIWRSPANEKPSRLGIKYIMAIFFGLIHGLGFSNYLKSLIGSDSSIVGQLLAFNLGLEIGQLLIVAIVLTLSVICVSLLKIERKNYIVFGSGAIFGIALIMALERSPF